MYLRYYRHLLKPYLHEHFPEYERLCQRTLELDNSFIAALHERHGSEDVFVDNMLLKRMRTDFLAYIERRQQTIYQKIRKPCKINTIGRWESAGKKRDKATIELTFQCFDSVYYQSWIQSETLDRLVWSNVIPILIKKGKCPYGQKPGIIFLID